MEVFEINCPYCLSLIEIRWDNPAAAWMCDACDATMWVRYGEYKDEYGNTAVGWYTARMKIHDGNCCGH